MGFLHFIGNSYGAFVGYVVLGVAVIVVLNYVVREVCYQRYGIDVCPGPSGSLAQARARRQAREDERVAMEAQREIERENQRSLRRKERRAKYEVFLKPYTMVVEENDLNSPEQHKLKPESDGESDGGFVSSCSKEVPLSPINDHTSMHALSTGDDQALLTLPVTTDDGKPRRVEACCSICLMEYKVGDSVIWSTRKKCSHAFHDECILTYLSHGKKRCPLCRNFFVPGAPVDCQKVIVDNGAEDDINETPDDTHEQATEEAIIEEIRARSSAHAVMDLESGSPTTRRRSDAELRGAHTDAETLATTNSAHF